MSWFKKETDRLALARLAAQKLARKYDNIISAEMMAKEGIRGFGYSNVESIKAEIFRSRVGDRLKIDISFYGCNKYYIRYVSARELGHSILHSKNLFIKSHEEISMNLLSANNTNPIKLEAHEFACELLMPKGILVRELRENITNNKQDLLLRLTRQLEVSANLLMLRLHQIGYDIYL